MYRLIRLFSVSLFLEINKANRLLNKKYKKLIRNGIFRTIEEFTSIVICNKTKYTLTIPANTKILLDTSNGEYMNLYNEVIYKCMILEWVGNIKFKKCFTFIDLKNIY